MPSPSIPMLSLQTNFHGYIQCIKNTKLCFPTGRENSYITPEIWYCLSQHFTFSLHSISLCFIKKQGSQAGEGLGKGNQKFPGTPLCIVKLCCHREMYLCLIAYCTILLDGVPWTTFPDPTHDLLNHLGGYH